MMWLPGLLALLLMAECSVSGVNDGLLMALASCLNFCLAGLIFVLVPLGRSVRIRALAACVPIALLLLWLVCEELPWAGRAMIAPDLAGLYAGNMASVLLLMLAAAALGTGPGARLRTSRWIALFGGIALLLTLSMRSGGPLDGWIPDIERSGAHRFQGSIGNPNAAGIFYAMFGLIAAGLALAGQRRGRGWASLDVGAAAFAALCAFIMVAMTQSRTAFILSAISLAILLFAGRLGGRRWLFVVPLLAIGLAILLAGADATLFRFAVADRDAIGRVAVWKIYGPIALHAPLAGYGPGSFMLVNQRLLTPETAGGIWSFGAAHNAALQFVIEWGWPAAALLGSALVIMLGQVLRSMRIAPSDPAGLAMLLAAGVATAASMVDIALNVPGIAALAASLFGMCWGRAIGLVSPSGAAGLGEAEFEADGGRAVAQ